MSHRRSYRGLMAAPVWGTYDANDHLLATIRAFSIEEATACFEKAGMLGAYVKPLGRC